MAFNSRPRLTLVPPALSEPSHARRFLQRALPDSWRFAHQMAVDLVRQLEFLAWAARADAFDTYFLRQAEAMLRPEGLTELINGPSAPSDREQTTGDLEERLARFCTWSRVIVTAVLLDLDERRDGHQCPSGVDVPADPARPVRPGRGGMERQGRDRSDPRRVR